MSLTDNKTIGDQIERLAHNNAVLTVTPGERLLGAERLAPTVFAVEGGRIVRRDDLLNRPVERVEFMRLKSISSFIDYMSRHKMPGSIICADEDSNKFLGTIDYEDGGGVLKWKHEALLVLEHTTAFNNWQESNDHHMSQEDFAIFLEENAADIVQPDAAVMLSIASNLRATMNASFESKTNLHNGEITFAYKEEVKGTTENGTTSIPSSFSIGVVIYRGQPEGVKLECKLRYRVDKSGKLTMWYSIPLLERALEQAFIDVKNQIVNFVPSVQMFDAVVSRD